MRFDPIRCPQCGEVARGTCDLVPGVALLDVDDEGEAEYSGETKMCWDGQYSETDENDDPILICPNDHQWAARISE
jgi:hypothetical protein